MRASRRPGNFDRIQASPTISRIVPAEKNTGTVINSDGAGISACPQSRELVHDHPQIIKRKYFFTNDLRDSYGARAPEVLCRSQPPDVCGASGNLPEASRGAVAGSSIFTTDTLPISGPCRATRRKSENRATRHSSVFTSPTSLVRLAFASPKSMLVFSS
jgi:hypothetical protein